MGLFSFLRRKQEETPETEAPVVQQEIVAPAPEQTAAPQPILQPYKNDALNKVYNLLFCDDVALFRSHGDTDNAYPWNILLAPTADAGELQQIIADPQAETRVKILAANKLQSAGVSQSKELLGVIAEVSMEGGLDVLASFKDGTARYINHAEGMIVWDEPDGMSAELTKELFAHAATVVAQIGPWDKKRLPYPPGGTVRLTFLVANGLYFGQAPVHVFFNDPMAGPVLNAASQLMVYLMDQTQAKED